MFKITACDLSRKSDSQLSGLFKEASECLTDKAAPATARAAANSLLAMIRAELSRRGPSL